VAVNHAGATSPQEVARLFAASEEIAMYACARVVAAHGGRVGCDAVTGTSYFFELPTARDALQILLVDDDRSQVLALAELLRGAGTVVATALSSVDALAVMRTTRIDVVVIDVELPGITGEELVTQLRADRPTLPVIVVSGHPADSERVTTVLAASRGRYLAKPLDVDALLRELDGYRHAH
ncbi:MAG TPA: response regulator, partial [Kofleriaceae bacterium]|nr:response regulator [Kofleriaceae bacterium]